MSQKIERGLDRKPLIGKPMKLHKFIAFISLPLNALSSIGAGIRLLTGAPYNIEGLTPALFYAAYPAVKSLDMIFGGAYIIQAVYCFYVCSRLVNLKENGPNHFKALAILAIFSNLVYLFLASSAMKLPIELFINAENLISVFVAVCYLVILSIYYNKRKDVFINR